MRIFSESVTYKDFEDCFPWDKRISEYTTDLINSGSYRSLIKEVEEKISASPKRKSHILSAYYINYTDKISISKDTTHEEHFISVFSYTKVEKDLLWKILVNYENEQDQALSAYKGQIVDVLKFSLNSMHKVATSIFIEDDVRSPCYGDNLESIKEDLLARIGWVFYTSVHYIDLINWLELKINETESLRKLEENDSELQTKTQLRWKGTPAQFGFIIDRLIQGGYLEKPASSFPKQTKIFLEHFDINSTPGTLEKEINEKTNSLIAKNRKKIIIPAKDQLE